MSQKCHYGNRNVIAQYPDINMDYRMSEGHEIGKSVGYRIAITIIGYDESVVCSNILWK